MKTRVTKDIEKYTGNFAAGMDARQVGLMLCGILAAVLLGIFVHAPDFVTMGTAFAFFAFALFKPEGLKLEIYLYYWIESRFLNSIVRHYERENVLYEYLWNRKFLGKKIRRKLHEKGKDETRTGVPVQENNAENDSH